MRCPDDNQLAEFAAGALAPNARAGVRAHLDQCRGCSDVAAVLARGNAFEGPGTTTTTNATRTGTTSEAAELAPGQRVGRFVLERLLGAGGMGVVYLAHDGDLQRKVAIKLIRLEGNERVQGQARLLLEARAVASLSHRNVVAVHEVGTFRNEPYIAMEYLDGITLRTWLAQKPRSWRAIVQAFVPAGEGLAAAHAAGIVHRDFKPANVMVCDGRTCVVDFGLARTTRGRDDDDDVDATSPTANHSTAPLTQVGTQIGTPRYMSPEQHANAPVDARSDQFSFCVALYEALHGAHPFVGEDRAAIAAAVATGARAPAPARSRAPSRIAAAIERGLATDPAQRFESMDALLAELTRDPAAVRRRIAASAAMAAIVVGAVSFGLAGDAAPHLCRDGRDRVGSAWNAHRASQLTTAFAAVDRTHAAATARRVIARLDAYATDWAAMYTEACEASQVRGDQSSELMDLRMQCLEQRRAELDQLATAFIETTDPAVVDGAVDAAYGLSSLDRCADVAALRAAVPPPDDPRALAQVDALRDSVAEMRALRLIGDYDRALALGTKVGDQATSLDYLPLAAEALFFTADLRGVMGDPDAAIRGLHDAVRVGAEARDDELVARAWTRIVYYVGHQKAEHDDALDWAKAADAAVVRAGDRSDLRATLEMYTAAVLLTRGEHARARAKQEHAIELFESYFGANDPHVADALYNLGGVYGSEGRAAEAVPILERSVRLLETIYGPDHPEVARAFGNLAAALASSGDNEAALGYLDRAIAFDERQLGPDHHKVATDYYNKAVILRGLGRHDEARRLHERALAIRLDTFGESHPEVARSYDGLGNLALAEGDAAAGLAYFRKALAGFQQVLPAGHPQLAATRVNVASALEQLGKCDAALPEFAAARDGFEAALGPDSAYVAYALVGIGTCELALGQPRRALPPLERSLAIRADNPNVTSDLTAESQFALARTAGDTYAKSPQTSDEHAEVEAWLAEH